MGYWLLRTYGLWYANPRPPSWWTEKYMGFRGLWVIKVMGYEGVNCTYLQSFVMSCGYWLNTVAINTFLSVMKHNSSFYLLSPSPAGLAAD
jgi:hypothetical protein